MRVNYGESVHGKDEIKAVLGVLNKTTQMGKNTKLFENKVSKLFNKKSKSTYTSILWFMLGTWQYKLIIRQNKNYAQSRMARY